MAVAHSKNRLQTLRMLDLRFFILHIAPNIPPHDTGWHRNTSHQIALSAPLHKRKTGHYGRLERPCSHVTGAFRHSNPGRCIRTRRHAVNLGSRLHLCKATGLLFAGENMECRNDIFAAEQIITILIEDVVISVPNHAMWIALLRVDAMGI